MLESIKKVCGTSIRQMGTSLRWILYAILSGGVIGLVGTVFYYGMKLVTGLRLAHPWLVYFLPVGGVAIVGMYRLLKNDKDTGTNLVLSSIHSRDNIPLRTAPLIFIATLLTHLFGGSAGREGAALQLGGSIGNGIGKGLHLDEKDRRVMIMCGMSAAFSALFGTPMAAAIFSMEVVSVGIMHYAALVPCVIASLVASGVASCFHVAPEAFDLGVLPSFSVQNGLFIGILAMICGFLSILFCVILHEAEKLYHRFFKNAYLRAAAGGFIVIGLTLLVGNQDYNGAGMTMIEQCMEGEIFPLAFLLKMVFTAATLGAGFKGGEIVPSFFVGASFGCLFGNLIGFTPSLCAAAGMGAVFCGVTNCPITSLLICFELFGYEGMPYYLIAVAISYMCSGYYGLYSSQKIIYSKYKTEYIDRRANETE